MDYSTISKVWANLNEKSKIIILTENERMSIAEKIKSDNLRYVSEINILDIATENYDEKVKFLSEIDLVIILLTLNGFMVKGYRDRFSPFNKPTELKCKYIFIRLDIPEKALLSGLSTDLSKVEAIISDKKLFGHGKKVRVTTSSGTDITTTINYQETLPYHARELGGNAFLPPSEISEELFEDSTNGIIVVDVTVGELRFNADLIDSLGIVDQNVIITVKNGLIIDIAGGEIAQRLKTGLDLLDKNLQNVIELGHGLSDIEPTGIIGVDESMNGTCHFGIGNRNPYHVDVVVNNPTIKIIED